MECRLAQAGTPTTIRLGGEPTTMSDSAALMKELHAAMDRWRLAPDGPLVETRSGCIAFVRHGPDRRVLKMLSPGSDETTGVSALAHYKGIGAVNILDR